MQEKPDLDFIYSDQDMIDEDSIRRYNPLYKPQWSQEMMYAGNYITHFSVLRTDLIRKIGGWEPDTDGAQDWDLFLKAGEQSNKIYGIPQILYHWRMARTSTASNIATKSYALDAQLRSIKSHLDRKGEKQAEVVFYDRSIFKIRILWNRVHDKGISIILLDTGRTKNLEFQLKYLRAAMHMEEKELIVVSPDEQRLEGIEEVGCTCILHKDEDWASGYQVGFEAASGDILLFCTDGVTPLSYETFYELVDWAEYDKIGVAMPQIMQDIVSVRSMGVALTTEGMIPMFEGCSTHKTLTNGNVYWYRNVSAADYNCFAICKDRLEQVGGFSGKTGVCAMAQVCRSLEDIGYRHMVTPYAQIKLLGETMTETCKKQLDKDRGFWSKFCETHKIGAQDKYYR